MRDLKNWTDRDSSFEKYVFLFDVKKKKNNNKNRWNFHERNHRSFYYRRNE